MKFRYLNKWIIGFCIAICTSHAYADTVIQPIESLNINAEASYLKGDKHKPVVLVLHGFLTTNKFHTVLAMTNALHDEGYSVISPTLTLNINNRKNSVKCNSLHNHTLDKDVLEIKDWVDWLGNKGYKEVILLGHSSGSLELLEYYNQFKDPRIKSIIFTSTFYLDGAELGIQPQDVALAKTAQRPHKYNFLFCKNNYFATPESFLSYLKLNRQYVLDSIKKIDIPTYTIMGGADKRYKKVGDDWLHALKKTGTELRIVEGANHFFSSEHEFDLQDNLVDILTRQAK